MPTQLRIRHTTEYHYKEPVTFGPHRAMIRPREGHDLHIRGMRISIEPEASIRWIRDIYDNSIALLTFAGPSDVLRIESEAHVDMYTESQIEYLLEKTAADYPFQYSAEEQIEIMAYRIPSYPHDGETIRTWLRDLYVPGARSATMSLLQQLNEKIFSSFRYEHRVEHGVQLPCETLTKGSGSCRDYAVFMMEAARHWGFAARFVTGYIKMGEGQHGATHAWTEIYLPGSGWQGFDPTNNKLDGNEHVAVAVAREQSKAAPVSGTWAGPADAFREMKATVLVEEIN